MEETKPRTANNIGMFDLLKGIGMLMIVFAHTAEYYSITSADGLTAGTFVMFTYRESLMAAFYIASGYGFRKRSIHKCLSQQLSMLLKPYLYTAAATSGLHLIIHYLCFGSFESALRETGKVLGGFALGLPHTVTYAGQQIFSCGPMWYLLSLMLGWILLDIILNVFPEPYIPYAVGGIMLLGWGISLAWSAPFCAAQAMVVTPYLYIGFLAKKRRLFDKPFSPRMRIVFAVSAIATGIAVLVTQSTDCISLGEWTMGPVSIVLDGFVGLGILALMLRWQRSLDGSVAHAVQAIGRRSLYIFCIHTVELTAIPWYLMAQRFSDQPVLGLLLQYAVSLASILLICEAILRSRDWRRRLNRGRSGEAAPRKYSARH